MLSGYEKTIEAMIRDLDEKSQKRLKVSSLIRLIKKLDHTVDPDIRARIVALESELKTSIGMRKPTRNYRKQLAAIQKDIEKRFGFVEKEALKERYMGMGIAIGVAIGAGSGTAIGNIAIGTGAWIAFGVVFGTIFAERKVKEATEKGLLY